MLFRSWVQSVVVAMTITIPQMQIFLTVFCIYLLCPSPMNQTSVSLSPILDRRTNPRIVYILFIGCLAFVHQLHRRRRTATQTGMYPRQIPMVRRKAQSQLPRQQRQDRLHRIQRPHSKMRSSKHPRLFTPGVASSRVQKNRPYAGVTRSHVCCVP